MAQLKLAERIIAEKDQDLHSLEYRTSKIELEKEALAEELVHTKSITTTSMLESGTASQGSSPAIPKVRNALSFTVGGSSSRRHE